MTGAERYQKAQQQRREYANGMISQAVSSITKSGDSLKAYLDVQSRFPRFSVRNAILILCQQPDMTEPGDSEAWKRKGAQIKRGAVGVMIFVPGKQYTKPDGSLGTEMDIKTLYDVTDTTAKRTPVPTAHYDQRLLLKAVIRTAPCAIAPSEKVTRQRRAAYALSENTIFVHVGMPPDALFQALAEQIVMRRSVERGATEESSGFAGYCICYMLCKRFGVSTDFYRFEDIPDFFSALDEKRALEELKQYKDVYQEMSEEMEKTLSLPLQPKPQNPERG